jgi:outer membrane protein OmpA-like peptidoglycan-associated protein
LTINVEGHTGSTGSDDYNQGLSERWAKAVADYLGTHGVNASRLRVKRLWREFIYSFQ